MTATETAQLENTYMYHSPTGDQQERYVIIRAEAKELAQMLYGFCPSSRERSVALTKLQEAVMWANASIAINEEENT